MRDVVSRLTSLRVAPRWRPRFTAPTLTAAWTGRPPLTPATRRRSCSCVNMVLRFSVNLYRRPPPWRRSRKSAPCSRPIRADSKPPRIVTNYRDLQDLALSRRPPPPSEPATCCWIKLRDTAVDKEEHWDG